MLYRPAIVVMLFFILTWRSVYICFDGMAKAANKQAAQKRATATEACFSMVSSDFLFLVRRLPPSRCLQAYVRQISTERFTFSSCRACR